MSYYNRELQQIHKPVRLYVAKSLYFGRHGDIEILIVREEEDIPERGYERPFKVVLASEQDARKWEELYRNSEIRDSLPNRSMEEIWEDNEDSKQDSARMDELEKAGKLAEAKWELLVNAPTVIAEAAFAIRRAAFTFLTALQSAEELGVQLSDEEKEDTAYLGTLNTEYGDLYKLATRLAKIEEKYFPQSPVGEEIQEKAVIPSSRHPRTEHSDINRERPKQLGNRLEKGNNHE